MYFNYFLVIYFKLTWFPLWTKRPFLFWHLVFLILRFTLFIRYIQGPPTLTPSPKHCPWKNIPVQSLNFKPINLSSQNTITEIKKVTLDVSIFQNSENFNEKYPHWKIREKWNKMKLKLLSIFILVNAKSNVQVLFDRP